MRALSCDVSKDCSVTRWIPNQVASVEAFGVRARGLDIVQIPALLFLEAHRQRRVPEPHEHRALLVRDLRQAAVLVRPTVLAYEGSHGRGRQRWRLDSNGVLGE